MANDTRSTRQVSFCSVWGAPLALAALTVFGLLAALLGTGPWHWASWLALAAPIAVAARFALVARRAPV